MKTRKRATFTPNEDSILKLRPLARYFGFGAATIYRDIAAGYVFEFGSRGTTPRHYRAWLRAQAQAERENGSPLTLSREAQERQEHELCRLH